MMKPQSILTILLLVLLSLTHLEAQQTTPPNIVIILTDDQGWGDLGISGNTNVQTPNIDKLAKEGARFQHFYVSPVCSPTRAEFLTGRYHPRGGVHDTSSGGERLDLDETTIAQVFKSAGYATAAYGKWHNGMQYPYHPNARGFDDFYGFCSGHWGDYFNPPLEHNGAPVEGNGFMTDDFTDHALKFIETNSQRPFFLYVPYNTPHSPMQVPDRWWNKWKDKKLDMRHHDADKEDVPFTRAALAMVENIDWNVGRIMAKLQEKGLDENTIVIFFSDNGPNGWRWNAGMKGRKGSTDEGGVRSPLIMRWPKMIPNGKVVGEIASAIDLLPTLVDLAGIRAEIPKPLDGISLKPVISGSPAAWPDRMIFSHWNGRVSLRTQQYRLDQDGFLYDMQNDPGQKNNLSDVRGPVAETLKMAVKRWRDEVLAELPAKDDRPFTFGDPQAKFFQLPARDGRGHGNITRSSKYPNCSFFTNWTSTTDSITWDLAVSQPGEYEVTLFYTCPEKNKGARVALLSNADTASVEIIAAHDPPLRGMENDRVPRIESYVKDFKPLSMGRLRFDKGQCQLTMKASSIPGAGAIDVRMLLLERKGD